MDHYHYLRRQTYARVARSCSGEMEREVHSILGPIGVKEGLSRLIANDLRTVEEDSLESCNTRSSSPGSWWKIWKREGGIRLEEEGGKPATDAGEMGLTAFLLKFGEGMGTSSSQIIRSTIDNNRGSTNIPTIHFRSNNRSLILPRRSDPTLTLPIRNIGRTRFNRQLYRHWSRLASFRSFQDLFHVCPSLFLLWHESRNWADG
jgi:hypothetical protein